MIEAPDLLQDHFGRSIPAVSFALSARTEVLQYLTIFELRRGLQKFGNHCDASQTAIL